VWNGVAEDRQCKPRGCGRDQQSSCEQSTHERQRQHGPHDPEQEVQEHIGHVEDGGVGKRGDPGRVQQEDKRDEGENPPHTLGHSVIQPGIAPPEQ
jgi:hypothetical protein